MARIIVTGSNGQVGYCLVERLKDNDDIELLALDREQLDITNQQAVNKVISDFKPDIVINAAAHTAVDKAETEEELATAINVDGVRYLAQACEKLSVAFLHISTDYVFDGSKEGVYTEEDSVNPQGVYGKTKLAGEIVAQHHCQKTIILRTAWVFGEHGHNFVKTMLRLAQNRSELGIVADQFGAPTYAGDIADALISIVNKILSKQPIKYGIYHFTGYPYINWYQFAEAIFAEAYKQKLLESIPTLNAIGTKDYPTPAKRPANSKLDLTKIKHEFGIKPSDWQSALKNIKAYI